MSNQILSSNESIVSKRQLIEYLASGCKPEETWRIGCEHEQFAFIVANHYPLPYTGYCSIQSLLRGLQRFGWKPIMEDSSIIALISPDGSSISLEPGGQIELSYAPLRTVHDIKDNTVMHQREVQIVAKSIGASLLAIGFQPRWQRRDIPWVPKKRYCVMGPYMARLGHLGLDMMLRTCTIQVNLDYKSEDDMVRKYRVALALQPIATAMLANSPFIEGQPSNFLSYRSYIWTNTDPSRCGMIPFVFSEDMGFERYTDYMLDVPLYFIYRNGRQIDISGQSFRDFMDGHLPSLPGEYPTLSDWINHLTTAFPEVRLKNFLEMRGVDSGSLLYLYAVSALWIGLLYVPSALDAALALVMNWTTTEREILRRDVPRFGLKTSFRNKTVREVALMVLNIAREGLRARHRYNSNGQDESQYLDPLFIIVNSGQTPAELLLEAYFNLWGQSVDPLFDAVAE